MQSKVEFQSLKLGDQGLALRCLPNASILIMQLMTRSSKLRFLQTFLNGLVFMKELNRRREFSLNKITEIKQAFSNTKKYLSGKACVYATGSFGRCEASQFSDLDVFIAGKSIKKIREDGIEEFTSQNILNHLDEICVQSALIQASRELRFPDFSGDGRYLNRHSIHEFTSTLGTEKDDVANTFTARLLLLLESKPLCEDDVYFEIVRDVISSYWRDFSDHSDGFMPAFLANDILRIWRTFCVNYEARTEREPEDRKASGKLKNYKLKHSRMLTCYSALLHLLAEYEKNKTVSPENVFAMISLTPTERLEQLKSDSRFKDAKSTIQNLLGQYERFLSFTNVKEIDLIESFKTKEVSRKRMDEARVFGDSMFQALSIIGNGNSFTAC